MDGKKLRRSQERRKGRDGIWMVSAWMSENRLVFGLLPNGKWRDGTMTICSKLSVPKEYICDYPNTEPVFLLISYE